MERDLGNEDWVDIAKAIRGTTKDGSGSTARNRNVFGTGEETHLGIPRESKLGADAGIIEDLVTPVLVEFVGEGLDHQTGLSRVGKPGLGEMACVRRTATSNIELASSHIQLGRQGKVRREWAEAGRREEANPREEREIPGNAKLGIGK